jgi:23S rRNA pseudouridine1911/1915/1917 synthase
MKNKPAKPISNEPKNLTFVCRKPNNLLDFLLSTYGSTATKIKKLIGGNSVFLNNVLIKDLKQSVVENDVVVIKYEKVDHKVSSIPIIYEDESLVVVNKPAGLLTVSDGNGGENLFQNLKKEQDGEIYICHRLDREVSGLLVFAKTKEVQEHIEDNWNAFHKTYFARVDGEVKNQTDTLTNFLKMEGPSLVRIVKSEQEGVKAITEYHVIKKDKRFSDLEITLHTGKKNQIRIQLSHIGHPIVGDKKFGSITKMQSRIALHSWKLKFNHPITNAEIQVIAPLPF